MAHQDLLISCSQWAEASLAPYHLSVCALGRHGGFVIYAGTFQDPIIMQYTFSHIKLILMQQPHKVGMTKMAPMETRSSILTLQDDTSSATSLDCSSE